MNLAEYIIKKLEELGVNDFFGVPGDYNFNILEAIEGNKNVNWVGCTNELNAAYAADGYARQKGYGAVITTYGVGELSAINAIAGAYAENVPLVQIVGLPSMKCINNKTLVHHNFQQPNYYAFEQAYKSVTATTAYLVDEDAKQEIDRVLSVMVKEKLPVYIAIPEDVARFEVEDDTEVNYEWESDADTLSTVIDKIATKINTSDNPVVLADILINRFNADLEFKDFVDKLKAPITNFLMGASIINSNNPMYIGGYYSDLENVVSRRAIENSDCLISVGTIYSDLNSFGQDLPAEINNNIAIYGTYTYVDGLKYDAVKMSDVLDGVAAVVESKSIEIEKFIPNVLQDLPDNEELDVSYLYSRLQDFIQPNDIVIAETGTILHGIAQINFPENVKVHMQALWGSIGWATPATLGVAKASPKSRVILITGDGAHQMSAMEIGNILRLGLKPIIIVINNNGYTIERILSDNSTAKYNDIVPMNYSKFARSFDGDIWATKLFKKDDCDKALKVTQIMNKLCYLEFCVDSMDVPLLTEKFVTKTKGEKEEIYKEVIIPVEKLDDTSEEPLEELVDKDLISEAIKEEIEKFEDVGTEDLIESKDKDLKLNASSYTSSLKSNYGTTVHKVWTIE